MNTYVDYNFYYWHRKIDCSSFTNLKMNPEMDVCPVCLDILPNDYRDISLIICGHKTCKSCYKKLLNYQNGNLKCPMCRRDYVYWNWFILRNKLKDFVLDY